MFFEYCSGGDLSRWVYRASDDGQLVRLCRQILGGVSYMHSQGRFSLTSCLLALNIVMQGSHI